MNGAVPVLEYKRTFQRCIVFEATFSDEVSSLSFNEFLARKINHLFMNRKSLDILNNHFVICVYKVCFTFNFFMKTYSHLHLLIFSVQNQISCLIPERSS